MAEEDKKPVMSLIPFEGLMEEITKLQGARPALIVLYTGPEDLTLLKHNLTSDDPIMEMFMRHLTIDVLKAKGIEMKVIKKVDSKDKTI